LSAFAQDEFIERGLAAQMPAGDGSRRISQARHGTFVDQSLINQRELQQCPLRRKTAIVGFFGGTKIKSVIAGTFIGWLYLLAVRYWR
jgi:hypothetical protein